MRTKTFGLVFVAVAGMLLGGCKGGKGVNGMEGDSLSTEFVPSVNDDFFMLGDGKLPRRVDVTQDIGGLNYQNLRLLRSYVYAIHGHWFMEGDLNSFFSNHTDWYVSLCDSTWDCWSEVVPKRIEDYYEALEKDYEKAYSMIELSKDEADFVAKIDARMEELMKYRTVENSEGVELLNANLMVNWFQLYNPEDKLLGMLYKNNIAFTSTDYQQLFNVYENNEYLAMPNFVTTDLMLQAYHMYFSYVLKCIESQKLNELLKDAMSELLQQSCLNLECCADQQLESDRWNAAFFSVGLMLLGEDPVMIVANEGGNLHNALGRDYEQIVDHEIDLVNKGQDDISPLFRTENYFNYSLFKPRGHYSRKEESQNYFRAMMWLQKGCMMREDRMQLEQAISMAQLMNAVPEAKKKLRQMDNALTFLMGEPDNVSLMELADWMKKDKGYDEQILTSAQIDKADKWLKGMFKTRNRIAPKVKNGPQDQLNIMPQRYETDNEVLATMYDPKVGADRAYPTGLDVMDVFGVKAATDLLVDYNKQNPWKDYDRNRGKMEKMMGKFDGWDRTMYNKWMKTLVEMQKTDKGQPGFMNTHAWALKNLNSALASWALLKHDAILYAEQPMAAECGGAGLPDPEILGYVEPNMPFWKEMKDMLKLLNDMLEENDLMTDNLEEKGGQLKNMIDLCIRCSERELAGKPIDKNDMWQVRSIGSSMEWFTLSVIDPDCDFAMWDDLQGADRCIAQVADVFTRNIDGCPKDGILYEATGLANAIYVVVEMKGQCYLTRGATYSYYEFVRPLGERLTDEQWQDMIGTGKAPAPVEWFAPLVLGKPVDHDQRFIYSTGC